MNITRYLAVVIALLALYLLAHVGLTLGVF